MLKKLMSLAVIGMLMVGCTDTKESVKHEVPDTSNSTRQEQQVQPKKEEVKKEQEQIKKDTTKKEQNDNIDPETGLAKVKDGKHLQEKGDKQDEDYGVWTKDYCPECGQPIDDCICDGDTDDSIDYSNTPIYDNYQEPDEFKDKNDYVQVPKDNHIIIDDTICRNCGKLKECCVCEIYCPDEQ